MEREYRNFGFSEAEILGRGGSGIGAVGWHVPLSLAEDVLTEKRPSLSWLECLRFVAGTNVDADDAGVDKIESELWCRSIFLDVDVDVDNFASVVAETDDVDVTGVDDVGSAAGSLFGRVGTTAASTWSRLRLRALTGSSGGSIRPLPVSSLPTSPLEAGVSCGKLIFFFTNDSSTFSNSF